MKKTFKNKNFEITVLENDPSIAYDMPFWVGVDYNDDWGTGDVGRSILDAAINCINAVWQQHGVEKAVELIDALIKLKLVPENFRIDTSAAVIDGQLWFGYADPDYPNRNGVQPWDGLDSHKPAEFSGPGRELAEAIMQYEEQEVEGWMDAYIEWESSWINGTQW